MTRKITIMESLNTAAFPLSIIILVLACLMLGATLGTTLLLKKVNMAQQSSSERWVQVTDGKTGIPTMVNMARQSIIVTGEIGEGDEAKTITKIYSGNIAPKAGPGVVYGWFAARESIADLLKNAPD